jgi:hypothetical protein
VQVADKNERRKKAERMIADAQKPYYLRGALVWSLVAGALAAWVVWEWMPR